MFRSAAAKAISACLSTHRPSRPPGCQFHLIQHGTIVSKGLVDADFGRDLFQASRVLVAHRDHVGFRRFAERFIESVPKSPLPVWPTMATRYGFAHDLLFTQIGVGIYHKLEPRKVWFDDFGTFDPTRIASKPFGMVC